MKNMLLIAAACAVLMACEKETIVQGSVPPEVAAANAAKAAQVVLPPSIIATKTYRCKDSSVVNVDWLSDKKSANVRADETATSTQLKAAAEGEALTAEGYSLTGDSAAASITLTSPGKGAQTCKA